METVQSEPPTNSSLLANDELIGSSTGHGPGGMGEIQGNGYAQVPTSSAPGPGSVPNASNGRVYPVVQVIAPESLSGGFTFDVEVNHEILTLRVPMGGVAKGQLFKGQTYPRIVESNQQLRVPMGGWKDSLFDFCRYGPFHSSLCLAVFCPLVALGQVYTRLGLSWNASPLEETDAPLPSLAKKSSSAFKIMVGFSVLHWMVMQMINPYDRTMVHYTTLIVLCFVAFLAGRTRSFIRHRYDIPAEMINNPIIATAAEKMNCQDSHEENGNGCDIAEDYIMACVCQPCVISQMNRHTALYDTYEGSCCSSNGLPSHAPLMVV